MIVDVYIPKELADHIEAGVDNVELHAQQYNGVVIYANPGADIGNLTSYFKLNQQGAEVDLEAKAVEGLNQAPFIQHHGSGYSWIGSV